MVIKADVLEKVINSITSEKKVLYMSPQGKLWNDSMARSFAKSKTEIVLICGRYAGIDQRFIQKYVDHEISIGDYVLSGGELAALVLVESISRFIPGVLGDHESAAVDSFSEGLLEAAQFTRPQAWSGMNVPEVLLSGHHQKIAEWKKLCGYLITLKKRPDLAQAIQMDAKLVREFYEKLSDVEKKILGLENLVIENLRHET